MSGERISPMPPLSIIDLPRSNGGRESHAPLSEVEQPDGCQSRPITIFSALHTDETTPVDDARQRTVQDLRLAFTTGEKAKLTKQGREYVKTTLYPHLQRLEGWEDPKRRKLLIQEFLGSFQQETGWSGDETRHLATTLNRSIGTRRGQEEKKRRLAATPVLEAPTIEPPLPAAPIPVELGVWERTREKTRQFLQQEKQRAKATWEQIKRRPKEVAALGIMALAFTLAASQAQLPRQLSSLPIPSGAPEWRDPNWGRSSGFPSLSPVSRQPERIVPAQAETIVCKITDVVYPPQVRQGRNVQQERVTIVCSFPDLRGRTGVFPINAHFPSQTGKLAATRVHATVAYGAAP